MPASSESRPTPPAGAVGAGSAAAAEKRLAAEAAALLIESGMRVGLGTGTTVAFLLPALAVRRLDVVYVATSVATEAEARRLGLDVQRFDRLDRLDIAIDGADQVSPDLWLVKGGGGAHTREKIVAAAADRFVVIVSSEKVVDALAAPVPLELLGFGLAATLRSLNSIGPCQLRNAPPTPDAGVLADYAGEIEDVRRLAASFDQMPGVVDHGLFPPAMVHEVLVGRAAGVERVLPQRSVPGPAGGP